MGNIYIYIFVNAMELVFGHLPSVMGKLLWIENKTDFCRPNCSLDFISTGLTSLGQHAITKSVQFIGEKQEPGEPKPKSVQFEILVLSWEEV